MLSPVERLNFTFTNMYEFSFFSHLHPNWLFSHLKMFSKTIGENSILDFHPLKLTKIKFLITLLVRVWGNGPSHTLLV